MKLPQGYPYNKPPWDYHGEMFTEGQMYMYAEGTARLRFAINAPDAPTWYRNECNLGRPAGTGVIGERELYFKWRWHFADEMIKGLYDSNR